MVCSWLNDLSDTMAIWAKPFVCFGSFALEYYLYLVLVLKCIALFFFRMTENNRFIHWWKALEMPRTLLISSFFLLWFDSALSFHNWWISRCGNVTLIYTMKYSRRNYTQIKKNNLSFSINRNNLRQIFTHINKLYGKVLLSLFFVGRRSEILPHAQRIRLKDFKRSDVGAIFISKFSSIMLSSENRREKKA